MGLALAEVEISAALAPALPVAFYQYDAVGNTLYTGDKTLEFNPRNRLKRISKAGEATRYIYSELGQRRKL